MRAILPHDIDQLLAAVLAAPRDKQEEVVRLAINNAEFGDRIRRDTGKVYPAYGDGTIAAAVQHMSKDHVAARLPLNVDSRANARALEMIYATLARHFENKEEAQAEGKAE